MKTQITVSKKNMDKAEEFYRAVNSLPVDEVPELASGDKDTVDLMREFAQRLGGKGGGRPDMAQGGGSDVAALPAVLKAVPEWVESVL